MKSFNVTWNKKPAAGKIFARKRKTTQQNEEVLKLQESYSLLEEGGGKIVKKQKDNTNEVAKNITKKIFQKSESSQSTFTKPFDETSRLIKRKQRKDKLAAKLNTHQVQEADVAGDQVAKKNASHSLFAVGHKDIHIKTNLRGKPVVEKVFNNDKSFGDLPIHKYIVSNLEKHNFKSVTNVQEKSIPVIIEGKNVLVSNKIIAIYESHPPMR